VAPLSPLWGAGTTSVISERFHINAKTLSGAGTVLAPSAGVVHSTPTPRIHRTKAISLIARRETALIILENKSRKRIVEPRAVR
jgi:hypothetical protein